MATITGKITINNVWACTFASDPSVSGGTVAPTGSFGSVNDGTGLWVKTGSGDTAWTIIPSVIAGIMSIAGSLKLTTVGTGLFIKQGTNATAGLATLIGGTLVVSTNKVTTLTGIKLTGQGGNILNLGSYSVTARVDGTSFTIASSNILDTNTVYWEFTEPA